MQLCAELGRFHPHLTLKPVNCCQPHASLQAASSCCQPHTRVVRSALHHCPSKFPSKTRCPFLRPRSSWQAAAAAACGSRVPFNPASSLTQANHTPPQATMKAASADALSHSRQGFCAKRPAVRLSRTTDTIVLQATAQHTAAQHSAPHINPLSFLAVVRPTPEHASSSNIVRPHYPCCTPCFTWPCTCGPLPPLRMTQEHPSLRSPCLLLGDTLAQAPSCHVCIASCTPVPFYHTQTGRTPPHPATALT